MKKLVIFLCLFLVTNLCFAYGDMSGAEYVCKDYEIDLDYFITQYRNEMIRTSNQLGYTVNEIGKLTNNEKRLLDDALYEYRLKKRRCVCCPNWRNLYYSNEDIKNCCQNK